MAYLRVHSRANSLYFSLSVLYNLAISGTKGSSGFGSQSKEHIDNNTKKKKKDCSSKDYIKILNFINNLNFVMYCCYCFLRPLLFKNFYKPFDMVSAGDHCDLKISKQILPLLLIFG